ncbi:hypothetical protein NCG97_07040 [Streptomyces lydicamycinicus]|uniref:hypothetical protein n=1 Tax=Streptomyces lydicamycinicus TaxID=1546107 RepID=UPI0020352C8C|nr:hypothetical protein [Streptomyces lydicamycinicus]USA00492.1 hypothetical protein NCG97_07040 [Streptomyces lydicamycinicus]
MTPAAALDAVIADVHSHPVDAGPGGFFTALRHIDLLSHLALRFAGDAHYHLDSAHETGSVWHPVEALTNAAVPLSRAQYHYAQAMVPLATFSKPNPDTSTAARLHDIEHHCALRMHLHAAAHSLDEARSTLRTPTPTRLPSPAAPPPVPTSEKTASRRAH